MQTVLPAQIMKGKMIDKLKAIIIRGCYDVQNLPQGAIQRFYQTAQQAKLAKWSYTTFTKQYTRIFPHVYIFIYHMNIRPMELAFIQQLLIVKPWTTQPMAKLVIPMERHSHRQPPIAVIQATTWWETILAHVKLMECGLEISLPAWVSQTWLYICSNLPMQFRGYFWTVNDWELVHWNCLSELLCGLRKH